MSQKVTIGTPFEIDESEILPKPAKIFDQVAVDDQGRRRFHGAFTGGFSAGYFNSVGSKEGWTPSSFKSSKKLREEVNASKPEDFMDDEDFGEHGIAARKLQTTQQFTDDPENSTRRREMKRTVDSVHSAIPGGLPIDELILPAKTSVGIKLLEKMGWKVGQGVGEKVPLTEELWHYSKKVYGCALPSAPNEVSTTKTLAPKDVQAVSFTPKDNMHGIGYLGINPTTALFDVTTTVKSHDVFRPTGRERKVIQGQAFGVGVFENEDDNIYATDQLSNYDVAIGEEETYSHSGSSRHHHPPPNKGCLGGFNKSTSKFSHMKSGDVIVVPRDYVARHVGTATKIKDERRVVSAKERSILLGESAKDVSKWSLRWDCPPSISDVSRKISRWDKPLQRECTDREKPSMYDSQTGAFKPFAKHEEKQSRYEKFLEAQKSGGDLEHIYDRSVTEWERERELAEFAKAVLLYRPLSSSIASRFTRATMVTIDETPAEALPSKTDKCGLISRVTVEWRPEQLLCKRFNIPDPYPDHKTKGIPDRVKVKHHFLLQQSFEDRLEEKPNDDVISFEKKKISIGPLSHLNENSEDAANTYTGEANQQVEMQEAPPAKPSIDMFKAVFDQFTSDSSCSEDEPPSSNQTNIAIPGISTNDNKLPLAFLNAKSSIKKTEAEKRQSAVDKEIIVDMKEVSLEMSGEVRRDVPIKAHTNRDRPIVKENNRNPPITEKNVELLNREKDIDLPIAKQKIRDTLTKEKNIRESSITEKERRDQPITEKKGRDPSITEKKSRDPPITEKKSRDPPITEKKSRYPPITEKNSRSPPITNEINKESPIAKAILSKKEVGDQPYTKRKKHSHKEIQSFSSGDGWVEEKKSKKKKEKKKRKKSSHKKRSRHSSSSDEQNLVPSNTELFNKLKKLQTSMRKKASDFM